MNLSDVREELAPIVRRMPAYIKLITCLYREPVLNKKQKALLSAGLAYALSPIDLIPGIIPVVGQLDDIIVALGSLKRTLRSLPPEVVAGYEEQTGITVAEIEADLKAAKKVAGYLAKTTLGYAWKGFRLLGRGGFRVIKRIIKKK